MKQTLGEKLSNLRREHGFTQDMVAERLGVSPQAVSKWENDTSCPDIMLLPQIAKLYETSIDALLNEKPQPVVSVIPAEKRKSTDDMILRIIVNSSSGDVVRVNLPIILVKTALEIGLSMPQLSGNEALQNIDLEKVLLLVDRGLVGKLVEVQTAEGDMVEIVVE